MNYKKYIYKDEQIKLIIEEDNKDVGWYLIVYANPHSNRSTQDYIYDSEELVFQGAEKKFGIRRNQWKVL